MVHQVGTLGLQNGSVQQHTESIGSPVQRACDKLVIYIQWYLLHYLRIVKSVPRFIDLGFNDLINIIKIYIV